MRIRALRNQQELSLRTIEPILRGRSNTVSVIAYTCFRWLEVTTSGGLKIDAHAQVLNV